MSLLGIADVGLTLASLFEQPTTVSLGGVQFADFASPDLMPWGGHQMHQVHRLPGGARVIDVFGRDDRAIEWGGQWVGADAVQNARAIDAMRIAGRQVVLAWDDFSYNVVITSFLPEYTRGGYVVRYKISVEIATVPAPAPPSLLSTVKSDLAAAASVASQVTTIATTVGAVVSGLGSGGSLPKTSPLYTSTVSGVATAKASATSAQTAADVQLSAVKGSPSAGTFGAAAATQALAAQQQSAAAVSAGAYLGRAANNLGSI